jgi:hypothetical protein
MDSVRDHPKVGFPHSEIFGSKPVRGSPKLIAAYHVLLRLLAPRHPPNALLALDQLLHLSKNLRSRDLQFSVPCRGHPPSTELLSHPRGRTTRQRFHAARRRPRRQDLCFLSTMSQNLAQSGPRQRPEPRNLYGNCFPPEPGGGERDRTDDLLLAKQALSQLSYTPGWFRSSQRSAAHQLVGQGGFEPPTSRLSSARSNQLSY